MKMGYRHNGWLVSIVSYSRLSPIVKLMDRFTALIRMVIEKEGGSIKY